MPTSSDDPLGRPLPPALVAYVDQLPEPLVDANSSLPVWALKLVEHYFEGGDLATVPGAELAQEFGPSEESTVIDVTFEDVVLRFGMQPGGPRVQTFVANDAPGRPAGTADGAGLACVLVFHEDDDGPHTAFDFEGVAPEAAAELTTEPVIPTASGVRLFAVDEDAARAAVRLADGLGSVPRRCRGSVCFVGRDGA